MKKLYLKPAMQVLKIQNQNHLLAGSVVGNVDGNANMIYGGASPSGASGDPPVARSRSNDVWGSEGDDEE